MVVALRSWAVLRAGGLLVAASVGGCSSTFPLMPTPAMYTGHAARPLFPSVPEVRRTPTIDLLYVTDRAPAVNPDDRLPYTAERSIQMSFGSVAVEFDESVTWDLLVKESTATDRSTSLDLKLGKTEVLGSFPRVPYPVAAADGGFTRDPAVVGTHEKAVAQLQAEVARRIAASPRKEVVLFVHGYANTFEDAALTMGELCHYLGRELVCAIFTWPAGGSRGLFLGYNVDRESGEFAVWDLKKAIRIIADTPGVERLHLVAHSRGTDVLTSALAMLAIESYIGKSALDRRYKIRNIVLMAPDMDADVATARVFNILSDPDLPYGVAPSPQGVFAHPELHLTVYVSPDDKALSVSQYLFGSLRRLGRVDSTMFSPEEIAGLRRLGIIDIVQVSGTTDYFGHSYFTSNPAVSSDLIALIRYGLKPNEPGRPLIEIAKPLWRVMPGEQGGSN
ncbi:MAG: alpha/beta hydrolase [Burkholderiales bacterium]